MLGATVKGVLHEGEHITSQIVHALYVPVAGLVGTGTQVARSMWRIFTFGGTFLHIVMGTMVGYAVWEIVRWIAPDVSDEITGMIRAPFQKRRRLTLDQ